MDGKLKETIDAMDAVSLAEHAFSWLLYLLDVPPSTIVPTFFPLSSTGELQNTPNATSTPAYIRSKDISAWQVNI